MTWSGMRGLVTLALVLSVPSGAFPFHHELAVIALTVLLVTMVIPGLLLPWLMRQLDLTTTAEAAHDKMRTAITERARKAALSALRRHYADADPEIAATIDDWFTDRLGDELDDEQNPDTRAWKIEKAREKATEAQRVAYTAAQQALVRMRGERGLNPHIVDEVLVEVDRMVLVAEHR